MTKEIQKIQKNKSAQVAKDQHRKIFMLELKQPEPPSTDQNPPRE